MKVTTKELFIEKSNLIHKNKYDYSLIDYKNQRSIIMIICPEHGEFKQIAYSHSQGIGCPTCGGATRKTTEEFIKEANKIHNFKYNYKLTIYKSAHKKVKIICPEHGIFEQTPNGHIRGNSCPNCKYNISKGEITITNYLTENSIKFIPQYKFENCKIKRPLPFDFYLSEHNICIEYDGSQHFRSSKAWGGEEKLKLTQYRDKTKNEYCKNNNIRLIRIKYNENILEKLILILH